MIFLILNGLTKDFGLVNRNINRFMRRVLTSKNLVHHNAPAVNFKEEIFHKYRRDIIDLRRQASTQLKLLQLDSPTLNSDRTLLLDTLNSILANLDSLENDIEFICSKAPNYDYKGIKANGYRSFLMITNKCCVILLNHVRTIDKTNAIWASYNSNEVISYGKCLLELKQCIGLLVRMIKLNSHSDSSLFFDMSILSSKPVLNLMEESNKLNQAIFYGPTLGFHYCTTAQKIFQVLGSIMSGYADSFVSHKSGVMGVLNTVYRSVSCFYQPEMRGQMMARTTRQATVDFTKRFWNLGEHPLVLEAPNIILPPVEVSGYFDLPAESFKITNKETGTSLLIPPPTYPRSVDKDRCIKLRLTSFKDRKGLGWFRQRGSIKKSTLDTSIFSKSQTSSKSESPLHRSTQLLIHIHGGGFVAQSAKAHDVYIRSWSERLDCPILSIDYSLAPEYPYPVALQECTYAVAWALRNKRQLGCSHDAKVILCGDSAGANLAISSALQLIEMEVTTLPGMCLHGIFLVYPPTLVSLCPSPARLMSVLDPLLPIGILTRCLLAYVGIDEKELLENYNKQRSATVPADSTNLIDEDKSNQFFNDEPGPLDIVNAVEIPLDKHISPLLAEDQLLSKLPPVYMIDSHLDPLLDDCIEMCKKLNRCGIDVRLNVVSDVPHGFLNFVLLSNECESASMRCIQMLQDMFELKPQQGQQQPQLQPSPSTQNIRKINHQSNNHKRQFSSKS